MVNDVVPLLGIHVTVSVVGVVTVLVGQPEFEVQPDPVQRAVLATEVVPEFTSTLKVSVAEPEAATVADHKTEFADSEHVAFEHVSELAT